MRDSAQLADPAPPQPIRVQLESFLAHNHSFVRSFFRRGKRPPPEIEKAPAPSNSCNKNQTLCALMCVLNKQKKEKLIFRCRHAILTDA
jgi:hypothetical protein